MLFRNKALQLGMATLLASSFTLPAFSQSILMPRLGYPSNTPKRVYLDVVAPKSAENPNAANAAETAEDKESRRFWSNLFGFGGASEPEPVSSKPEASLNKSNPPEKLDKMEARKQAEIERLARMRERREAYKKERDSRPVDGTFFLYDLKQKRLVYQDTAKMHPLSDKNHPGRYYIEFSANPGPGMYDVAVRGSGHRSSAPLWISDAVYWDALQPVVQDIKTSHCPKMDGRFRIVQQCFTLNAQPADPASLQNNVLVKGGWFTASSELGGMVKSTSEIAEISQMLMQLYLMNPDSYKYVTIPGDIYEMSKYPDLLDEANWGLQYLVTTQQADGGMPEGIESMTRAPRNEYQLLETSPEATAKGVMALATAASAFQKTDLSQSVKFLRAAKKGWYYLQAHAENVSPEGMVLASYALMNATSNGEFAQAYQEAAARLTEISPEAALMIGYSNATNLPLAPSQSNYLSSVIRPMLPHMVGAEREQAKAFQALSQDVTDLYGYEKVAIVRDPKFEMSAAWMDPLQWMATKTGDVATRLTQRVEDQNILRPGVKIDSSHLQTLEDQEQSVKKRIQYGYSQLKLTTLDKAYLAYALAQLNRNLQPDYDPNAIPEDNSPRNYGPGNTPEGFYRSPI